MTLQLLLVSFSKIATIGAVIEAISLSLKLSGNLDSTAHNNRFKANLLLNKYWTLWFQKLHKSLVSLDVKTSLVSSNISSNLASICVEYPAPLDKLS